jgi:hypothetical protein
MCAAKKAWNDHGFLTCWWNFRMMRWMIVGEMVVSAALILVVAPYRRFA